MIKLFNMEAHMDGKECDACPICLEPLTENETGILNCAHEFCRDCLSQLYKSNLRQNCPVCREPIQNEESSQENNAGFAGLSMPGLSMREMSMPEMSMPEMSMPDMSRTRNFYVHFENKETCKRFMNRNSTRVGNSCCSGKGCLITVASSQTYANSLKYTFLNSPSEQNRTAKREKRATKLCRMFNKKN